MQKTVRPSCAVLPSLRLRHNGQGGVPVAEISAWIIGFDKDWIGRELAGRPP